MCSLETKERGWVFRLSLVCIRIYILDHYSRAAAGYHEH